MSTQSSAVCLLQPYSADVQVVVCQHRAQQCVYCSPTVPMYRLWCVNTELSSVFTAALQCRCTGCGVSTQSSAVCLLQPYSADVQVVVCQHRAQQCVYCSPTVPMYRLWCVNTELSSVFTAALQCRCTGCGVSTQSSAVCLLQPYSADVQAEYLT